MTIAAGTRFGPYVIEALLGTGGMGEVYRAHDTRLKRAVALKMLPASSASDPDRLARFQREAQVLASLDHPHIGAIYGIEESDGTTALVLQLVEGDTLADRVARGPIPPDEALPIARQIAEALEAAHENGVIHRDLKPANVKITPDGQVKVLDFGLAKLSETGGASESGRSSGREAATMSPTITTPALMTGVGVILGTAAYMSPEQAKGRTADKRSDIWAFGCVVYEMLTGRRAFDGDDVAETLAAVIRGEPDWSALPTQLPAAVSTLIRRCVVKDRRERISDIAAVLFVLRESSGSSRSLGGTSATPASSRWLGVASYLLVAVAVAALTSTAWWSLAPSPPPAGVARLAIVLSGQNLPATVNRTLAISPDGTTVVFAANQSLYLRRLAAVESERVPIASLDFGFSPAFPAFSPDGASLVFYSPTDRTLRTVAVAGGAALTLGSAARIFGIDWDEQGIVFAEGSAGIKRVVPGGTPEVIATVQPDELAADPQVLPDGDSLLFTLAKPIEGQPTWDQARIVVQSLKSQQRTIVFAGGSDARYVATGHIVYAQGGVLYARAFDPRRPDRVGEPRQVVAGIRRGSGVGGVLDSSMPNAAQFAVSENGSLVYIPGPETPNSGRQLLVLTDRTGGVTPLQLPQGPYQFPRASPNPKVSQVVYGTDDGKDAAVWLYNLDGAAAPSKLTFSGRNRFPIWSDDAKSIAYQSDREGDLALFRQRLDDPSGKAERMTKPEGGAAHVPEAWFGNNLLFSETKGQDVTLHILSVRDGTTTPFPGVRSSKWPQASFSRDGRWVAYAATPPAETRDVLYVEPFPPTGVKHQVAAGDAHFPVWNGNHELLWMDPTRSVNGRVGFVSAMVTTTPRFEVARDRQQIQRNFNITAGAIGRARTFDILPDGQRFVGVSDGSQTAPGQTPPHLQVVINWHEELKRLVH